MLLAVGGGFFSLSTSRCSEGLMILLLGRSKGEKSMKIAPSSNYQLAEQEDNLKHQLATKRSGTHRGCASFMCFHHASPGVNGPSSPKVDLANHSETLLNSSSRSSSSASDHGKACTDSKIRIKSSLKKPSTLCSTIAIEGDRLHGSMEREENSVVGCAERRKVQWTDSCGRELVEIKEFEPSDNDSSDDDFDRDFNRNCQCVIQ